MHWRRLPQRRPELRCPPEKAHLATLAQLRSQRLKPVPDQRPVDRYWQGHGWVQLYDHKLAIPMRPPRPATPRQRAELEAGQDADRYLPGVRAADRAFRGPRGGLVGRARTLVNASWDRPGRRKLLRPTLRISAIG